MLSLPPYRFNDLGTAFEYHQQQHDDADEYKCVREDEFKEFHF